jgi:hypothetical protein
MVKWPLLAGPKAFAIHLRKIMARLAINKDPQSDAHTLQLIFSPTLFASSVSMASKSPGAEGMEQFRAQHMRELASCKQPHSQQGNVLHQMQAQK